MADKRISQLVDRGTIANNDVVPIVVSGAVTTNKATISSIQTFMQGNLDLGVTSVGITLGTTGTDVSVSGSPITSSGNITINIPTASATNRGALSSADWSTFNSKQGAITLTTTGTSGASTLVGNTLNIPNYTTDLSGYVTLGTTQTITSQKTFTTSGSSDTMIISHGSGSGFALDVIKAGSGEAIRVQKTSGSGNAMTISGGNFEAGTIVKTGGTSSQFLKADGSVDSSTYLTTGTAASTYVPYTGATTSVDLGDNVLTSGGLNIDALGGSGGALNLRQATGFSLWSGAPYTSIYATTGNRLIINFSNDNRTITLDGSIVSASTPRTFTFPDATGTLALTSDIPSLTGYVTLDTTQTITGAKTFETTTSTFALMNSTNANGGVLSFRRNGTNVGHIGNSAQLGGGVLDAIEVRSGVGSSVILKTDGGQLTLATGGGVTLTGALNGTSGAFTGAVSGSAVTITATTGIAGDFTNNSSTNETLRARNNGSGNIAAFRNLSAEVASITNSGGLTLSGALNGTSASFSADIQSSSFFRSNTPKTNSITIGVSSNSNYGYIGNDNLWGFRSGTAGDFNIDVNNSSSPINAFKIAQTGAATFATTLGIGITPSGSDGLFQTSGSYGNLGGGTAKRSATIFSTSAENADRPGIILGYDTAGGGVIAGATQSSGQSINFWTYNGSAWGERMRITSGGALLVNQTTLSSAGAGSKMQVATDMLTTGSLAGYFFENRSGGVTASTNWYGWYAVGGTIFLFNGSANAASINPSTGAYTALSDENKKKDFEESNIGLNEVLNLKPTLYRMKDDESEGEKELGFIAQEVKEFIPQAYVEGGEEDAKFIGLNYNAIVAALVKSVQELKTEIDSLKNQIK